MDLVKKAKKILRGTRGETLIEGLASILVFTVLIASVTMMIVISLRITAIATAAAQARQVEAREVLTGNAAAVGALDGGAVSTDTVTFEINGEDVDVAVTVFSTDEFTAFQP